MCYTLNQYCVLHWIIYHFKNDVAQSIINSIHLYIVLTFVAVVPGLFSSFSSWVAVFDFQGFGVVYLSHSVDEQKIAKIHISYAL